MIRRLWYQVLFAQGGHDLTVLASLLRQNLIPAAEVQDAITRAVAGANNEIPNQGDLPDLKANGYDAVFENYVFTNGAADRFDWGNRNADLLTWYVANHAVTDLIMRKLCSIFAASPYPFTARASLASMFRANPAKRAELAQVAQAAGVVVPVDFQ